LQKFIEGIDANDNGISAYPSDIKPKFESALSITGIVAALNPTWNEPATDADIDKRFEEASTLMGEQFLKKLDFYGKAWLPARDIVVRALEENENLDPQGRILHLPQFCPWKVCLSEISKLISRNISLIWRKSEVSSVRLCISYFQIIHLQLIEFKLCRSRPIALKTEKRYLRNGVV